MIDKLTPQAESAHARQLLASLAHGDAQTVWAELEQPLRTPQSLSMLQQLGKLFPAGEPKIEVVGAHTNIINGVGNYALTYQYSYPGHWLLASVNLRREQDKLVLQGLQVQRLPAALQDSNRFELTGKPALHYLVLALAMLVPLLIIYALVRCIRTPLRRKWAWLLFIALGLMQLQLNWSTGGWAFQPLFLQLLGAGFVRASPYSPVILTVALPLGAIVFLWRRKALLAAGAVQAEPAAETDARE
ncbi:hypothetical protein [Andreprevotia lacus]|nr:hypothetical protein [Andreprevotia lacus]